MKRWGITYVIGFEVMIVYFRNVLHRPKPRQCHWCSSRLLQLQFRRSDVSSSTPVTGKAWRSLLSGLIFPILKSRCDPFVPRVFRKLIRTAVLQVPMKAWLKDSQEDSFTWLSRTERGFQVFCTLRSQGIYYLVQAWECFIYLCLYFYISLILCPEVRVYRNQRGADEVPAAKQQAGQTEHYFLLWEREQAGFKRARNPISCRFSETEFLGNVARLRGMLLFLRLFLSINLTLLPGFYFLIRNFWLQSMEEMEPRPDESVFQFETEDLELLPIRDLALFGHSELAESFGFTIGPVCFS